MKKSISEMSPGELRNTWLNDRSANVRTAALREYERRRVEQPSAVRRALEDMIDCVGLDKALGIIAQIAEARMNCDDEGEALRWAVATDAIRQAAAETESC